LVAGGAWFGGTVLLAVLLGLSLPARQALVWVAVVAAVRQTVLTRELVAARRTAERYPRPQQGYGAHLK